MADLDQIPDTACTEVRFFHDHWLALKGEAQLPATGLIDPINFSPYLSRVFIVEGGGLNVLQVRLAGSVYRYLYDFEITGMKVVDLIPFGERDDLMANYASCLKNWSPIYHKGNMNWRLRGTEVAYERILLPFGSDKAVERILGFAQFFDGEGQNLFN
jgi:hypothetical protein